MRSALESVVLTIHERARRVVVRSDGGRCDEKRAFVGSNQIPGVFLHQLVQNG